MEKSVQITLIIVAAVIIVAMIPVFMYYDRNPGTTVNAQGTAEIKAIPDIVTVYLNVRTRGEDAVTAKDKNSEIVDDVVTALIKQGFERKDIQTLNYNIYPEYEWANGKQVEKGYLASHQIRVEMPASDSRKIGEVIDAGVDNGANVGYINFELSLARQNEYKSLALKQATEDARIKAGSIASGLGKNLGRVVSVSSSDFGYYPWTVYSSRGGGLMEDAAEAKTAATSIQPSEQTISANVQVIFVIR